MTYLTTKDLQDLVRVDKSTIYRMAEEGRIPAVKVGRQWRFPAEGVVAWLGGDVASASAREPWDPGHLADVLTPRVAQGVIDVVAEALGIMAILTDMEGRPLTAVANPCGLFSAVSVEPAVQARCMASWARYGAAPDLVPRFGPSDFGFLCARAFVRGGSALLGMVIAGGIARDDWPPGEAEIRTIATTLDVDPRRVAEHIDEVYRVEEAHKGRILSVLPKVAGLISNLAEERVQHAGTLAAIAGLADTRSKT